LACWAWLKPLLDSAAEFSEGFAAVRMNGKRGYIDGTGAMRVFPRFDRAGDFSGGPARVDVQGNTEYVDENGELVCGPTR